MARYNERKIPYETQVRLMDSFCKTISQFKSKAAVYNFFKDMLNRQERMMLIRRLLIAEMLQAGHSYRNIMKQLHCGSTTIARVQRWLNFGRGGYKTAIKTKKKKN